MILKKIRMQNIRSYENVELEFPLGSTVLSGDIGSGKTSILLAIEFALFGLQPGQRGSSLLRNGKDRGYVSLEIEIDDNTFVIERGLKRGKSISQSYARIQINGKQEEKSITELKNKVLSLLNYPKEFFRKTNILYRFTVYTPQEQMRQIILEKSEARLDTLRHIFGIDKYKRIRENTDIFTSRLREKARGYEGEIKNLEELRKKLREKQHNLQKLKKNLTILKKEFENRRKKRLEVEEKIKEIEKKIEEKERYEREAEKTNIMLVTRKELISSLKTEIEKLRSEVEELTKIKLDLKQMENKKKALKEKEKKEEEKNKGYLEIVSKIRALNSKISESKNLIEQISNIDLCPTCLQEVSEDYKKNIVRKLEEDISKNTKQIFQLNKEKQESIKGIEDLKKEILILTEDLANLNLLKVKLDGIREKGDKLNELEKQKISAEKDVSLLEKQILTLKEAASVLKKFDLIHEENKEQLQELMQKEKEKEIELASSEKERDMTLDSINEIGAEIEEKEAIKSKLLKITELEDWLSSSFLSLISFTERNIMLKLREEFSKLFNEWFNILVPEIFTVRLDEEFTPIIQQQDYQLDYSFLSGGERTAIALAYRLALNQVINSLLSKIKTRDLVILDEPTDGFSEAQLDKMRDVLNQLKVKQLILVSHEPKIESFVEHIIKFKKEAGVTSVENQ